MVEKMMYHGEVPWHDMGKRLADSEVYDMEVGIVKAGLDWEVGLEPLYLQDGRSVERFAVVRSSDRSILGNVGPKYTPLQNREAFKFFNPFLESKACKLHTAGSLDHGRIVWVLCHVSGSGSEVVLNDRVDNFALLSSGHDGAHAIRVGFTPVRVVCCNTLKLAHHNADSKLIRVLHTKSVHDNLQAIQDVMDVAHKEFAATMEQYRKLANTSINQKDVHKYVRKVLNIDEALPLDQLSSKARNLLQGMEELAYHGTGCNIPGVKGTLWAAYNGVTEALSYGGSNREKRLESLWFGSNADRNRKALEIALEMAS
jgi:phage/plasmid-like protein (TIGR03299 family)